MEANVWNAERLVREYVKNQQDFKRDYQPFPCKVRARRMAAYINACLGDTRPCDDPRTLIKKVFGTIGRGYLESVSELTDEAIGEFMEACRQAMADDRLFEIYSSRVDLRRHRSIALDLLLSVRGRAYGLLTAFSGVLEAPPAGCLAIKAAEEIYFPGVERANAVVDHLIALLMGERFRQSFTEEELIEQYGYPTTTDQELDEWEIDHL